MLEHLPPPWREWIVGVALASLSGLIGRLMYHSRQVQAGRRRFLSASLLWELPVAIGTGLIGQGIADYYGLGGYAATACIVIVAYLGPGFVEAVVWRLVDRWAPAKAGDSR